MSPKLIAELTELKQAYQLLGLDPATVAAELAALQEAFQMMGLDPAKVAKFVSQDGDYACKCILFQCAGVTEDSLKASVGERANIAGWMSMWDRLRLEQRPQTVSVS